jgi:hypothetical protein
MNETKNTEGTMMKKEITCYGLTKTPTAQQEWYETASGDARRRASYLRGIGFDRVIVSSPLSQVTKVGHVRMTLLTIPPAPPLMIPAPDKIVSL